MDPNATLTLKSLKLSQGSDSDSLTGGGCLIRVLIDFFSVTIITITYCNTSNVDE